MTLHLYETELAAREVQVRLQPGENLTALLKLTIFEGTGNSRIMSMGIDPTRTLLDWFAALFRQDVTKARESPLLPRSSNTLRGLQVGSFKALAETIVH